MDRATDIVIPRDILLAWLITITKLIKNNTLTKQSQLKVHLLAFSTALNFILVHVGLKVKKSFFDIAIHFDD